MQGNLTLDISLRPSRQLAVLLIVAHGLALAVVWHLAFPLWLHTALKLALAASLVYALLVNGWFGFGSSPVALRIEPARKAHQPDAIEVRFKNGQLSSGFIVEGSFVAPYVTVVRYKRANARRWHRDKYRDKFVLIFSDSLDGEAFRALRVRLKWGNAAAL